MSGVLIGCECSGEVREAFRSAKLDAYSCDIQPDVNGPNEYHIQRDLIEVIEDHNWDLVIAHPPCTYLTHSAEWAYGDGPYHQKVSPGTLVGHERRVARLEAIEWVQQVFSACWRTGVRHVCIENPVGVLSTYIRPADQYVQPYEFGDNASKKTGLWLVGLPTLKPTKRVQGRMVEHPKGSGKMVERWANQTDSGQNRLSPSKDRAQKRSKTYPGIARAMALQWGPIIKEEVRLWEKL